MALESINPATGALLARYDELGDRELDARLSRARDAFGKWRETGFSTRAELLRKTAARLRADARRHAETMTLEMGKPIREALAEVEKCARCCDHFAEHAKGYLAPEEISSDAARSFVRFDPLGPVLAVMPWNFPFWQVFRFAAPALMAGDVALLKHASNVCGCALAIESSFREAGYPEGAFTTLLMGSSRVAAVIADDRVAAVTITGSEPAGRKVAAAAGAALKKTVLELGGSDAFVVLEDADLDVAAREAARARTINSGQSCIAAKRFIIVEPVLERFLERFGRALSALRLGDPLDERTDVGPQARGDLRDELHAQVERSVAAGARLVMGGRVPGGAGCFYPVTLLADVTPGMAAFDEETFGPVAAVIRARDEDDAIALANRSRFGLGASIWTREPARGEALAARVEAGAVFVGGAVKSDPRLPFGGVKCSGYGRELSHLGIRELVNAKTVWVGPART